MAHFLTTTDSSAAIERGIREAEQSLTLISAFVAPRIVHPQRLWDVAERGVEITFIFGKKPMHLGVFRDLRTLPNMKLYFLRELHAKCYFNEHEAVVISLNLLGGLGAELTMKWACCSMRPTIRKSMAKWCRRAIASAASPTWSTVRYKPEKGLERTARRNGLSVAVIEPQEDSSEEEMSTIERVRKKYPRLAPLVPGRRQPLPGTHQARHGVAAHQRPAGTAAIRHRVPDREVERGQRRSPVSFVLNCGNSPSSLRIHARAIGSYFLAPSAFPHSLREPRGHYHSHG